MMKFGLAASKECTLLTILPLQTPIRRCLKNISQDENYYKEKLLSNLIKSRYIWLVRYFNKTTLVDWTIYNIKM